MNENYAAFFENDKNTVELRHTFFKKLMILKIVIGRNL